MFLSLTTRKIITTMKLIGKFLNWLLKLTDAAVWLKYLLCYTFSKRKKSFRTGWRLRVVHSTLQITGMHVQLPNKFRCWLKESIVHAGLGQYVGYICGCCSCSVSVTYNHLDYRTVLVTTGWGFLTISWDYYHFLWIPWTSLCCLKQHGFSVSIIFFYLPQQYHSPGRTSILLNCFGSEIDSRDFWVIVSQSWFWGRKLDLHLL